jgi:two-component system, OmpR family, response regulator RegX3
MTLELSRSIVLAFAANVPLGVTTDLSDLQPIPVRWTYDLNDMISQVGAFNPASMIVAGDGDNIASMRTCYALRQACDAPLHLISSTMSESEANLARSLGATTVNTPSAAPAVISQFVRQFLKIAVDTRAVDASKILEVGAMQLDLGRRKLCIDGMPVSLTRTEFDLLTPLVRAAGSVVSRADLVAKVWGANWFGVENVLDTHLAHLRRKLADTGFDRAIVNVRGVGFYFEPTTIPRGSVVRM